jgi:UDP-N-acetylmuramate dehydrogenase
MNSIQTEVALTSYNTLGVPVYARSFVSITHRDQLPLVREYLVSSNSPYTILGGGSNILFCTEYYEGLVMYQAIKGYEYTKGEDNKIRVTVGAGEVLDEVIEKMIHAGLWGLENLSHIPGSVGATPVQNVGAYGVEVKDTIESVEVYDLEDGRIQVLSNADCQFGYRDSIFKHTQGGRYIILSVTFLLSQTPAPKITYADLASHFEAGEHAPTALEIRDALRTIRGNKFPDWHTIGTAGSFFKNPIITKAAFETLLEKYPHLPGFDTGHGSVKVSLGYILDKILGLRGHCEGAICLSQKQALVLTTQKNTRGEIIYTFAQSVCKKVFDATGITIEMEVSVIK